MRIGQMKKSGVRGETERFFFELIKGRVQIDLPRVPNIYNESKDKRIRLPKEHFSYQTANSTTNTKSRSKGIVFSRFGVHSRKSTDIKKRFFARNTENRSHQRSSFFRARPKLLDAENTSLGTQISSRRAGDIVGYSCNAAALCADATGDSILLR
jgi:hypothetical protein